MSPILASYATCSGQTPIRMYKAGVKMTAESLSLLVRRLFQLSLRNTTST